MTLTCGEGEIGLQNSNSIHLIFFSAENHQFQQRYFDVFPKWPCDFPLVGSDDHTVRLWSCVTGVCLRILHTHNTVATVRFDDYRILTASFNTKATLWDFATGKASFFVVVVKLLTRSSELFLDCLELKLCRSLQGTHCTGKTGKMANKIPCQGKHREFGNFAKTQGKHREFGLLKLKILLF